MTLSNVMMVLYDSKSDRIQIESNLMIQFLDLESEPINIINWENFKIKINDQRSFSLIKLKKIKKVSIRIQNPNRQILIFSEIQQIGVDDLDIKYQNDVIWSIRFFVFYTINIWLNIILHFFLGYSTDPIWLSKDKTDRIRSELPLSQRNKWHCYEQ